ncbi:ATP-binding cassette domain-containing protein [Limibaculum sp. FT325]|uniref:ABC-F family ATP-binding cassette domain-containing protein n=1 Tax=Thermohalobaculum sediminis TaxID=2939436 RepID=UPI0020BE4FFC|nr:ATP-binding cassette domain-containing protein [Limibaculum sediminis]MCL5777489.1 ATP-binding cassette domain-containing protein [Limibaculum sediminis]
MAPTPILTLTDITLGFGGRPLFAGVSLALGPGEKACVVGRNGSGKSTLLKIAAGLVEPDGGSRWVQPGARVAYLPQDPDPTGYATLGDYVAADLPEAERWRAEAAMDGLEVEPGADPATASGGERRRAALARLIAGEPDLMLLDEPTNHLDIAAIEWLEEHLSQTRAGYAVISHDRAFLSRLTRSTLWLDRGEVRRNGEGFAAFEDWREKLWAEEDAARHKLDRLIAQEAHWSVYGISARRTRNQGRLRRLEALRAERRAQVSRQGPAAMALEAAGPSGKRVIEAEGVAKSYDGRTIFRDFSIRIGRGERVALVGPNGAGKTTLLKVLTGQIVPDTGAVRLGTNIEMAVFDQNRAALDPEKSLWETLTEDKLTRVSGASDQVMVRGRPRHVVAYLKDFLFDERQARGPVGALSGGEKARLLLARIMARPSNLLVLDEPTNDLDVETLDLLQELIEDFDGTVLLVSHDRDFLDRVATTTIAMEGDGRATIYAGGWSDYRAQRGEAAPVRAAPEPARKPATPEPVRAAKKLSYKQERRLADLPAEIERLTAEIGKLENLLSDPDLYSREPVKFAKATEMLDDRRARLDAAETEWLELEELRESLAAE